MMNEKDIEMRCGKQNPFTVPAGYFDSLTDRVMANLPQNNVVELKPRRHNYWKEFTAVAAACIAGVVIFVHTNKADDNNLANTGTEIEYDEQYQMDMMEYAMMDGNDVYAYLSGDGSL